MKSLLSKRILCVGALILSSAGVSLAATQAEPILFSTGSASFTIDEAATTARYTQSTESLSFSPSVALGDTIGGLIRPAAAADLSTAQLALIMKSSGPDPNLPFTIELFTMEAAPRLVAKYTGNTSGSGGTPTLVALQPVEVPSPGVTEIVGLQLTWDGNAGANIEVLGLAVLTGPTVPAPSPGTPETAAPTPDRPSTAESEATPTAAPVPPQLQPALPALEITSPSATRKNSYLLRMSVTGGKDPAQLLYRLRAPGSRKFGRWLRVPLPSNGGNTQEARRSLRLNKRGIWRVEILLQDANETTIARKTVPISRR